jgi:hypothetical protein
MSDLTIVILLTLVAVGGVAYGIYKGMRRYHQRVYGSPGWREGGGVEVAAAGGEAGAGAASGRFSAGAGQGFRLGSVSSNQNAHHAEPIPQQDDEDEGGAPQPSSAPASHQWGRGQRLGSGPSGGVQSAEGNDLSQPLNRI